MLRILHTSDWHLGKRLYDWSRYEEQRLFLTWLVEQICRNEIDLLLVCGDIFDSSNPSAEAEGLYYGFLAQIKEKSPQTQVIITAGNHDSALRLSASRELLSALHISVSCFVRNNSGETDYERLLVPVKKAGKQVATCIALPYLRQGDYDTSEGYEAGVGALISDLYEQAKGQGVPVIAAAHLFVAGGRPGTESRMPELIGTAERVSAKVFPEEIRYVALGHLHRPHTLTNQPLLRYAGSPLPFDFSEEPYPHGVTLAEVDADEARATLLPFDPPAPLVTVSGNIDAIASFAEKQAEKSIDAFAPFLHVELQSDTVSPLEKTRIRELCRGRYIRLAKATLRKHTEVPVTVTEPMEDSEPLTPLDVARRTYAAAIGTDMPPETEQLFAQAVEDVLNKL